MSLSLSFFWVNSTEQHLLQYNLFISLITLTLLSHLIHNRSATKNVYVQVHAVYCSLEGVEKSIFYYEFRELPLLKPCYPNGVQWHMYRGKKQKAQMIEAKFVRQLVSCLGCCINIIVITAIFFFGSGTMILYLLYQFRRY